MVLSLIPPSTPGLGVLPSRADLLSRATDHQADLLVIGGGITGAGIARDAALRGLRTVLVERDDFASGTSSRSSRLVHGGVRYLEHGHLHLVFESSRERRILHKIAPHLVHPLQFTWPVYRGARLPRWKIVAGLWLYDLLAFFRNEHPHRALSSAGVLAQEPNLRHDALTGGASYFDAATDDARLTLANVISAAAAGASTLNYAEVTALQFADGCVSGACVRDRAGGATGATGATGKAGAPGTLRELRASVVVNATGPWSGTIAAMEDAAAPPTLHGSKGVHITVPAERVGNRAAVTMLSPTDGRVLFTLPAGPVTIIGTTETDPPLDPSQVRATRADVQYLLDAANAFWPGARLTPDDVITAWAGIRPLVASHAASAGDASREHAVTIGPRGMVSITGGKLTTYRAMAEEVVDTVERQLGRRPTACVTAQQLLPDPALEFARTIGDVLIRRTKTAFTDRDHGLSQAERVANELASEHGWTDAQRARAVDDYRTELARLFTIDP